MRSYTQSTRLHKMERQLSTGRSIISTVFDAVPNFPLSGTTDLWAKWSCLSWTLAGSAMSPHGSYVDVPFSYPHGGMAPAPSGGLYKNKWIQNGWRRKKIILRRQRVLSRKLRTGEGQERSSWWWKVEMALVLLPTPRCPVFVFYCWVTSCQKCSGVTPVVSVGLDSACRLAGSTAETLKGWSRGVSWGCSFIWSIGSSSKPLVVGRVRLCSASSFSC